MHARARYLTALEPAYTAFLNSERLTLTTLTVSLYLPPLEFIVLEFKVVTDSKTRMMSHIPLYLL